MLSIASIDFLSGRARILAAALRRTRIGAMAKRVLLLAAILILGTGLVHAGPIHAALDDARPAGMAYADWLALMSAIEVPAPYRLDGELGPAANSRDFGWSIAASGHLAVVGAPKDPTGWFPSSGSGSAYLFERSSVDGRWRQIHRFTTPTSDSKDFGYSVAISGNTVVVGAPSTDVSGVVQQGRVFIFNRRADGDWAGSIGLTVAGGPNARFGTSVALHGNTLAVGAPNAGDGLGWVMLYERTDGGWALKGTLRPFSDGPSGPPTGSGFGWSLTLDSQRLVVGMPFNDTVADNRGAAYVFERDMTVPGVGWAARQRIDPYLAGQAHGLFGASVALLGDRVVVGHPGYGGSKGLVHLYVPTAGSWVPETTLLPPGGEWSAGFGHSLALVNGTLAVGEPGGAGGGAAHLFGQNAAHQWELRATVKAIGAALDDDLGYAIALADDATLLTGIPYADGMGNADRGRVVPFSRTGTTWAEQASLSAIHGGGYGHAIAISGNTLVVAQFSNDNGANVYVRESTTGFWQWQATLPYSTSSGFEQLNTRVAIDGDTIVLGAPFETYAGNSDQGAAYVYVRSGTHWTEQAVLRDPDGRAADRFGTSVAVAGNTVAVGAPESNERRGTGYVFVRSGGTWSLRQRLIAPDGVRRDNFGWATAISGDTIVFGAPYASGYRGGAYVFERSGSAWTWRRTLTAPAGEYDDWFGSSIAASADSVIVGAPGTNSSHGAAYVFAKVDGEWDLLASLEPPVTGDTRRGYFGTSVAIAGRAAIVGDPERGYAHVYQRRGATWSPRARIRQIGTPSDPPRSLGYAVAISGTRIAVGAHGGGGAGRAGRVYILDEDGIFADGFDPDD